MEKRLTRSDFVFILVFIFMLIFALAAFFYGMKIGSDRTELKYADLVKQKQEEKNGLTAYHQSYLVSFYHTVYLPFREFQFKWERSLQEIQNGSSNGASLMKELSRLAEEKYEAAVNQTMPNSSPLLQDGHQNYLKSLKLYSKATKSFQSKGDGTTGAAVVQAVMKDAYFTEAGNFALTAQQNYYDAIVRWHQSMESGINPEAINKQAMPVGEWKKLSLTLKNAYIAKLLAEEQFFNDFTPQDVTLRVDELLANPQVTKKFGVNQISEAVDLLISTHAVRRGDFVQGKGQYYPAETLPQLPFFSKLE